MRGRVTHEAGGRQIALRFTTNRLCALEESTGRSVMDWARAMESASGLSMSDLRVLVQHAYDGEAALTREQAGDLLDDLGLIVAGELVGRALQLAFTGGAEAGPDKAGAAGKPKAAA